MASLAGKSECKAVGKDSLCTLADDIDANQHACHDVQPSVILHISVWPSQLPAFLLSCINQGIPLQTLYCSIAIPSAHYMWQFAIFSIFSTCATGQLRTIAAQQGESQRSDQQLLHKPLLTLNTAVQAPAQSPHLQQWAPATPRVWARL